MYTKTRIIFSLVVGIFLLTGCKPDYPNCKTDEHCHEGEFCVNNLCQQCRGNDDCAAGQECSNGACRDIPGYCNTNEDCAPGQFCRNNTCGPCMTNEECGDGQVCQDGACITAECMQDDQCPAGLSCVNYKCINTEPPSTGPEPECTLKPIYFEFDSSEVGDEMRSVLTDNYTCMQSRGGQFTLEGHCDAAGTTEYNMALGERRARMVSSLLKRMGADANTLRIVSKGEEEATGENVAADRRVEFK